MTVLLTQDNEELAKAYDVISDSQFDNGKLLVEKLGIKPGDSVLDIGAGTGRLGRYVNQIIGSEGSLIGIDPLAERIKIANEKNQFKNAVYKIGSTEDLSFIENDSIDVVYLNAVFHWVIDKQKALNEIYRVLKPGGKIGLTTGAKELSSLSLPRVITDRVLQRDAYKEHVNFKDYVLNKHGVTTGELIDLFINSNLAVTDLHLKSVSWTYKSGRDIVWHSESSSFGNYLNHVPDSLKENAKQDIADELDKYRVNDEIAFDRLTIFAVAQKKERYVN